jgi:hypothetical protein
MIFRMRRFLPLFLVFIAVAQICRAQAPNGPVSFTFGADDGSPIYDLSGSFAFNHSILGAGQTEIPLAYGIELSQDVRGFLTGSGLAILNVGNDFVAANYTARGKVTRTAIGTIVTLNVRLKGQDVIGGNSTAFNVTINYRLFVSGAGTLDGTARGNASFGRLGSGRIFTDVSVALPPNADGNWTLQMNIVPFSRLSGTAQVILTNGRTLQMNLTGSYSTPLNRSVLRLTGAGDSRGNSLTVIMNPDALFVHGRILGQTVRIDKFLGE